MGVNVVGTLLRRGRRGSLFSRSTRTSNSTPSTSSLPSSFFSKSSSRPAHLLPEEEKVVAAIGHARLATSPADAAKPTATLLASLAALTAPLSRNVYESLTTALTTSPPFLLALVSTITAPASDDEEHDPLSPPSIAARLVAHGGSSIARAIVTNPQLLETLAAPFAPNAKSLPSTLTVDRAADVLRVCLVADGAKTASALSKARVLPGLVQAAPRSAAAAHLLARLVGTRAYAAPDRVAVAPCHKRGLVLVSGVQRDLADVAINKNTPPPVAANLISTMAELASRAMLIQKKHEDYDERSDAQYVGHLNFIPASRYNDACRSLSLLESPAPLLAIVDAADDVDSAAGDSGRTRLRSALSAAAGLLFAARDGRVSALPSVRAVITATSTSTLTKALLERVERLLLPLLVSAESVPPPPAPPPPRKYPLHLTLAAVDVVTAILAASENDVLATAVAQPLNLHVHLVKLLAQSSPTAGLSVARTRIADVAVASLRDKERAGIWLRDGAVLELLSNSDVFGGGEDAVISSVLVAAADAVEGDTILETRAASLDKFRSVRSLRVAEAREVDATAAQEGLLGASKPNMASLSADAEGAGLFDSVEDSMNAASEDCMMDMYLRSQLQSALPTRDTRLVIPTTASAVTISRAAAASGKKLAEAVTAPEERE